MMQEDLGRCIGCDYWFTAEDWFYGVTEVTTQYGDGFAHEECVVEGMMVI